MIRLHRRPLGPAVAASLEDNARELVSRLLQGEVVPDAVLDAYRIPALKEHLIAESHGKCMYCESKVSHVYYGDVEHIKPKAIFKAARLSPDNLGFVCAKCNGAKGDFWNDAHPLVDPFVDNPLDHLLASGCMIVRVPGSTRGMITVRKLKLNRPELLERRCESIERLEPLADKYAQETDPATRAFIAESLLEFASVSAEHALVVRAYLWDVCGLAS